MMSAPKNRKTVFFAFAIATVVGILAAELAMWCFRGPRMKKQTSNEAENESEALQFLEEQLGSSELQNPHAQLVLHISTGNLKRDQGHYRKAFTHYEKARVFAAYSGDVERQVTALYLMGLTRYDQGKLQDAQLFLEQARDLPGTLNAPKVLVLHALANVRREMGNLNDAISLYWEAWKAGTGRGRLDAEHLPILVADLSEAYARIGRGEQARMYLEQALQQHLDNFDFIDARVITGAADANVEIIRRTLAGVHHAKGDVSQAMGLYRRAVRGQTRLLRPGHPDLIATQIGIARAKRDLGDLEGAMQAAMELETVLRAGPQEGLDLSRVLILKADFLRESKQYEESEKLIMEAIQLQSDCLGTEDHPEVAVSANMYGFLLHDQGRFNDALDQYTRALEINLNTVGFTHPETAATHNSLGTLFQDAGEAESAQTHFTTCLKIQLNTVGEQSPDVGNTYNNLATLFFKQGLASEAAQYFRKALHILDRARVSKENPDRVLYADNLSQVLSFCETSEEASCKGTGSEKIDKIAYLEAKQNTKHTETKRAEVEMTEGILTLD